MEVKAVTDAALLDILAKLEPDAEIEESLRKLLLAKARNDLIRHRLMDHGFQRDYGMDFFAYKSSEQMKRPSFKVEQDYFDWELTVTRIEELGEVIEFLHRDTR